MKRALTGGGVAVRGEEERQRGGSGKRVDLHMGAEHQRPKGYGTRRGINSNSEGKAELGIKKKKGNERGEKSSDTPPLLAATKGGESGTPRGKREARPRSPQRRKVTCETKSALLKTKNKFGTDSGGLPVRRPGRGAVQLSS